MPTDTTNTNQHYVSQMLQRGFTTTPNSEQVCVFDKQTGNNFVAGIRNIAAERGYYDLDQSCTLDTAMNLADDETAYIINRIRNRQSLACASRQDREVLAIFVILQML